MGLALRTLLMLGLLASTLPACSPVRYAPKPLGVEDNTQRIVLLSPTAEGFHQYLQTVAPEQAWPIQQWSLDSLTLSALYFHPALKVAKSDFAVALAGIRLAGLKPSIGLNGHLARSNQANGDLNPWSYGLQVDIPIVTANKREINIEIAQYQADIAKIQIAETAWQLRYQLQLDLIDRAELMANIQVLKQLQQAQQALLAAYEKRQLGGLAGKAEVLPIQLQYDQARWQTRQAEIQLKQVEQKVVHDAGLTEQNLNVANIETLSMSDQIRQWRDLPLASANAERMRTQALTNRMDIQRGLAQYAQAESRLKLEIAKLTPDLNLSPGILFDFGDKVWGLGIGGLLNLLNKRADLWAQADKIRQNEADRFYALQTQVIQRTEQVALKHRESLTLLDKLSEELDRMPVQQRVLAQQWRQGLIDKTEWLQSQVQLYALQQRLVAQQANVLRSFSDIENTMQRPLTSSFNPLPVVLDQAGA